MDEIISTCFAHSRDVWKTKEDWEDYNGRTGFRRSSDRTERREEIRPKKTKKKLMCLMMLSLLMNTFQRLILKKTNGRRICYMMIDKYVEELKKESEELHGRELDWCILVRAMIRAIKLERKGVIPEDIK